MALVGPCKKQWLNRIWVCMPGGNCRERGHYYGHAGGDGTRWRLRYSPLGAIWRLAVPLFCRTDNEVESSPRFLRKPWRLHNHCRSRSRVPHAWGCPQVPHGVAVGMNCFVFCPVETVSRERSPNALQRSRSNANATHNTDPLRRAGPVAGLSGSRSAPWVPSKNRPVVRLRCIFPKCFFV